MQSGWRRRAAFTLPEMLLAGALAASAGAAIALFFGSVIRAEMPDSVTFGGRTYRAAPSYEELENAILLHQSLLEDIEAASAIFVLGGYGMNPDAPSDPQGTIALSAIQSIFGMSAALAEASAEDLADSRDLAAFLAARSVAFETSTPDAGLGAAVENFTVVCVGGAGAFLSATQCRTFRATTAFVSDVYRITADGYQTYAVAIPLEMANTGALPGAWHGWIQTSPYPVAGAQIVRFPDPYMTIEPLIETKTRFHYVLPTRTR